MSRHLCHWPGCDKEVPPAMWGCHPHWKKLPLDLQHAIRRTYRQGQEIDKSPSREYIAVARRVRDWILSGPGAVPQQTDLFGGES